MGQNVSILYFTSSSHPNSLPSSKPFQQIHPFNSHHFFSLPPSPLPPPLSSLSFPFFTPSTSLLQKPCHLLAIICRFSGKHPPTPPLTAYIGHSAHCHWKLQTGFGKQGGELTLGRKPGLAATSGNEGRGKGAPWGKVVWFGWKRTKQKS